MPPRLVLRSAVPAVRLPFGGSEARALLRAGVFSGLYAVAGVRESGDSHPRAAEEICWGDGIPSRWPFWCECGRRCAGRVGGGPGRPGGEAWPGVCAVRVLRAGVNRGLAGFGDVASAAARAGDDARSRARHDRGRVLRCGGEPDAGVGAAPAGCRPGGCRRLAGGSTGTPRTTSRPCSRWACRPSGRSPGPGIRVRTAMATRTREQGRYLGGRPPYGYRLADAGPHPNKAHPVWGRRAHRLEPDPVTAPVVKWMFAQRLAGHSAARITRALNDAGVPCPSAADPGRNPHRTGSGWTLRTVAAILANPRYTGRQVWNRQPSQAVLVDPADTGLGHKQVQRWNLPQGWVISRHPAHTALVSEADFIAAQDTTAPRGPAGPAVRRYLLAGLI